MPSSSKVAQTSAGARSANRGECSASRMAWRSAAVRARGWARSRCGTGARRAGAGLARWQRYQLACATPAARHAARVPIRGASAVIAALVKRSAPAWCPRPRRASPRAPEVPAQTTQIYAPGSAAPTDVVLRQIGGYGAARDVLPCCDSSYMGQQLTVGTRHSLADVKPERTCDLCQPRRGVRRRFRPDDPRAPAAPTRAAHKHR